MPQIKKEKKEEVEKRILDAIQHYKPSEKRSIRTSAETFGIAYSTLRGRLTGRPITGRRACPAAGTVRI